MFRTAKKRKNGSYNIYFLSEISNIIHSGYIIFRYIILSTAANVQKQVGMRALQQCWSAAALHMRRRHGMIYKIFKKEAEMMNVHAKMRILTQILVLCLLLCACAGTPMTSCRPLSMPSCPSGKPVTRSPPLPMRCVTSTCAVISLHRMTPAWRPRPAFG